MPFRVTTKKDDRPIRRSMAGATATRIGSRAEKIIWSEAPIASQVVICVIEKGFIVAILVKRKFA